MKYRKYKTRVKLLLKESFESEFKLAEIKQKFLLKVLRSDKRRKTFNLDSKMVVEKNRELSVRLEKLNITNQVSEVCETNL